MSFCSIFLFFSVMSLLDHHVAVASCDENCTDKPVFTPSKLVVKYGDPASARCSVCQHACQTSRFGLEIPVGVRNETTKNMSWTVDRLTEWDTTPLCFYNDDAVKDHQCCSKLPITVYQPPDNVSISFAGHTGLMFEDHQYTLQCEVQRVAPVGHLTVTFYRGQKPLEPQLQSNNTQEKKPVSETFTLNITPSKEHDGGQYWCEAKLDLGPEGPRPPPVEKSLTINATVFYKPHLKGSSHSHSIIVTEGSPLQLNCSAVGNPSPSYTWTVPGHSSSNSNILTIDSVTSADKGQFICLARNDVGNVTVVFNVEVQVDYTIYIILAVVIAAVVCIIVATVVYMNYYKHHRMGKYNPKDVFRFSKQHSLVPTA